MHAPASRWALRRQVASCEGQPLHIEQSLETILKHGYGEDGKGWESWLDLLLLTISSAMLAWVLGLWVPKRWSRQREVGGYHIKGAVAQWYVVKRL